MSSNTLLLVTSRPVQAASLVAVGKFVVTRGDLSRRRNTAQSWTSTASKSLATQALAGSGTVASSVTYVGGASIVATDDGQELAAFSDVACPDV